MRIKFQKAKLPAPFYQKNGVTLYHGDNRKILPLLNQEFSLVLTSPPYDNLRDYAKSLSWEFKPTAKLIVASLRKHGVLVWNVNDATIAKEESGSSFMQALYFKSLGLKLHDTMIWNKSSVSNAGSFSVRYGQCFEYMFVLVKDSLKTFNSINDRRNKHFGASRKVGYIRRMPDGTMQRNKHVPKPIPEFGQRFNIWEFPPSHASKNYGHPAAFPLSLCRDHVISWTSESDLVLDPFCGSGTLLKAAQDLNRRAVGIESNEAYCKMAVKRLTE